MSNLPVGDPSNFVGEFEEMDLSELKDKVFGVALNSGKRSDKKFICSSLAAPLDFWQMIEAVGTAYEVHQIHAKCFVLKQKIDEKMKYLDECTIDFIEANYMDITMDGLLGGALGEDKQFTCRAGFLQDDEVEAVPSDVPVQP